MKARAIKLDSKDRYTRLFSVKNSNAMSLRSGHVVLQENENIGEHNTGSSEEVIIALEGKGRLYAKGCEALDLEEGTALYVPPDTVHDVKNSGKGVLRYVYVTCAVPSSRGLNPGETERGI
jgi:mannose-6-phosphate isomerase-like protein (cupin superfamily)